MTCDAPRFDVRQLYLNGEAGAVYDPSDLTAEKVAWALANPGFTSAQFLAAFPTHALYQDSAGTTPVTALGQPVGLVIDSKTGGLANTTRISINEGFDSGSTGWSAQAGWTISSGQASVNSATAGGTYLRTTTGCVVGQMYRITFTVTSYTSGTLFACAGTGLSPTAISGTGTFSAIITADATNGGGVFASGTTTVATVDNVVVELVPGVHAIQPTSASRPLLDARVNLLVATATLSTQNVITVAANYQLQFSGGGTITLSGTASGTLSAGTHTIAATAGTLTLTVSGTVTNADFRLVADAAYPYQGVTTATNYADVGVPRSFLFDGVDDRLLTSANMDLSGTDKVTVLAGVRKLSDAVLGTICEHTSASMTVPLFAMFAPRNSAIANYAMRSRGSTATVDATTTSTFAAPGTHVLAGLGDTGAPLTLLRVNGTEQANNATVQGASNYRADLLYIGGRYTAGQPLNGKLYQLIVRGAATTAGMLELAERYVAQRTGITL